MTTAIPPLVLRSTSPTRTEYVTPLKPFKGLTEGYDWCCQHDASACSFYYRQFGTLQIVNFDPFGQAEQRALADFKRRKR